MAKLEMTKAGEGTKEGPNKVLLVILGVLCAFALFMFVVKPLVFSGDKEPTGGSPEASAPTQSEPGDSAQGGSGDATATSPGQSGATATAPGTGEEAAPATPAGSTPEAAYAELPAEFTGNAYREDPFGSLDPAAAAGSGSTPTSD